MALDIIPAADDFESVTANLTPPGDDRLTPYNCGVSDAPSTLFDETVMFFLSTDGPR